MTMTLVETVTLGSAQASMVFSNIPQTATDLYLVYSARNVGDGRTVDLSLNGSQTGFSMKMLQGNGSAAVSASGSYDGGLSNPSSTTTSTFSNTSIYFANYSGSTNKSWSMDTTYENNNTLAYTKIQAGTWSNTAAITSITLTGFGNFAAGSTASLYTITKGSGGATVS
jgi:hypothetical protein